VGIWVCGCTAAVRRVQWWGYVSGGAIASGWCGLSGHHVGAAPGGPLGAVQHAYTCLLVRLCPGPVGRWVMWTLHVTHHTARSVAW
jgi:hypothetical protein